VNLGSIWQRMGRKRGAGVVDRLRELVRARELAARVVAINVGERPRDRERFERRRDELYAALREQFPQGTIAVAEDKTAAQLSTLRYRYASSGQLAIESKDDLRARSLPSPDRADALMLAFAPEERSGLPWVAAGEARRGGG
jgi:hypothetical protein